MAKERGIDELFSPKLRERARAWSRWRFLGFTAMVVALVGSAGWLAMRLVGTRDISDGVAPLLIGAGWLLGVSNSQWSIVRAADRRAAGEEPRYGRVEGWALRRPLLLMVTGVLLALAVGALLLTMTRWPGAVVIVGCAFVSSLAAGWAWPFFWVRRDAG